MERERERERSPPFESRQQGWRAEKCGGKGESVESYLAVGRVLGRSGRLFNRLSREVLGLRGSISSWEIEIAL